MDYIRNSKNRKLKTQILNFFARLNFGSKRLDIAGKSIIIWNSLFIVSLFLPWIHMKFLDGISKTYSAFSLYSGGIGYGMIIGIGCIFFFLLSHQKKERIRAYVPFRLSDAQAIVFIDALIMTACLHLIVISLTFTQFALNGVSLGIGFVLALTASFLTLLSAFFFSKNEKIASISISHLDKKDTEHLSEYEDILHGNSAAKNSKDSDKNMTLPI